MDTYTLVSSNNYSTTIEVDKYSNGEEIEYTITAPDVNEYSKSVSGVVVTYSHTPGTTDVTINILWSDNNNQDGKRPLSISVELLSNNEHYGNYTLGISNEWSYLVAGIPKYLNEQIISYTVNPPNVEGYTYEIDGRTITYSHTPEKKQIPLLATWDDNNNEDGKRPDSITVTLFKGTQRYGAYTLSSSNNYSYNLELDKYESGVEIEYS